MPKTPEPQLRQLVRVTYRIHSDAPVRSFVGEVVEVRPPGEGPIIHKPGKRTHVIPRPGGVHEVLAGWYSTNEIRVVGWAPEVLSTGQMLLLDGMAAWYALGHNGQEYQAARGVWGMLAALERRGLVEGVRRDAAGWVSARITDAGLETVAAYRRGMAVVDTDAMPSTAR